MNSKTLVPLSLAVILGLVAAFMARHLIKGVGKPLATAATVPVVVAKSDLAPGHELTAEDLAVIQIAASKPPANSFSNPASLARRVTVAPAVAGQPILENLLGREGTAAGLQALVPPGMRAITLDVTESSGLGGLLAPGSHVDVVATAANPTDNNLTTSRVVVQDAPVLAVGQQMAVSHKEGENAPASHTVTLLVNPHDAATLDLCQLVSRVRLILRGNGDKRDAGNSTVMLAELRGIPDAQRVPTPVVIAPTTQPAQPTVPAAVEVQPVALVKPVARPQITVRLILGTEEQYVSFGSESERDPFETTTVDKSPELAQ